MQQGETKIRCYNSTKVRKDGREIGQSRLAKKLGKTYRSINLYVNNEVQPPIPVLYEIANILGVKPSDLLNDKPTLSE